MDNLSIIYDEEREITSIEKYNLQQKQKTIPVEYLRKNLFNATTRESHELKRLKIIYDDGKTKIKVNRSLHLKHRDLLSILFTDNKGVSKPLQDGSYLIYTNLYDLAKKMGYKNPKACISNIQKYLNDLRYTDFIIEEKNIKRGHMLLGDFILDKETNKYAVKIPPATAKYYILNYTVQIPKEINRKIIAIPNKYAKTKALVSYLLSNKQLKNGIAFNTLCEKFDINDPSSKSNFKKELELRNDILKQFNIEFDKEKKIIKYIQLGDIKFLHGLKEDTIINQIQKEQEHHIFENNKVVLNDKIYTIKNIEKKDNYYILKIKDKNEKLYAAKIQASNQKELEKEIKNILFPMETR